jgi:DNA-directed RNA polymerase subunit H (RpoH/RPB5)
MLARVFSAAVQGIEAFPVEVEVNAGWGDTVIVMVVRKSPQAQNY